MKREKGYPKLLADMYRIHSYRPSVPVPACLIYVINQAIDALIVRENGKRTIEAIKKYYGLGCEAKNYEEIGLSFDRTVTRERVRQIIVKGISLVGHHNPTMRPVVEYLVKAGYQPLGGSFENILKRWPTPEQEALLNKNLKEFPAQGHFLNDCLSDCGTDNPCPTCQAKTLLAEAGILEETMDLAQKWRTGASSDCRNTPVSVLDLSVRSDNSLKNLDVVNLGQLCEKTEEELLSIPNFGPRSLNEIKRALDEYGLFLKS